MISYLPFYNLFLNEEKKRLDYWYITDTFRPYLSTYLLILKLMDFQLVQGDQKTQPTYIFG